MKIFWVFLLLVIASFFGCARVRVEAPKEPIKVDITMRLDIYQHVTKDIDAIEDIVTGGKPQPAPGDKNSRLYRFIGISYAQEGLSPEVESAALRRKDRLSALNTLQQKGIVGENKAGLLVIKNKSGQSALVEDLVKEENSDRMIIYKSVAQKNKTSIEEVQKLYAKKLQDNAPAGTPIEAFDKSKGQFVWKIK